MLSVKSTMTESTRNPIILFSVFIYKLNDIAYASLHTVMHSCVYHC